MRNNRRVVNAKIAVDNCGQNIGVLHCQFPSLREMQIRLCELAPLIKREPDVQVWNCIVWNHREQASKYLLGLSLAFRKPEHHSEILAGGYKGGIEREDLAIEYRGIIELLRLRVRDGNLVRKFPVGRLRAMLAEKGL